MSSFDKKSVVVVQLANNVALFWLQYSRNVSQTCWIIEDERMGEASVEVFPWFYNSSFISLLGRGGGGGTNFAQF